LLDFLFLPFESCVICLGFCKTVSIKEQLLKKKLAFVKKADSAFFFCDFFFVVYFFYFLYGLDVKKNFLNHAIVKLKKTEQSPAFFKSSFFYLGESFSFFKSFFILFFLFIFSTLLFLYVQLALELLPLSKLFFAWLSFFFFLYLLLSGFVFFLKRYNFSKFTTIISRF
jgi:hypothetical protein